MSKYKIIRYISHFTHFFDPVKSLVFIVVNFCIFWKEIDPLTGSIRFAGIEYGFFNLRMVRKL